MLYIVFMADGCGEHDEQQKADDDLTEMIRPLRYPETAPIRQTKLIFDKKNHYTIW